MKTIDLQMASLAGGILVLDEIANAPKGERWELLDQRLAERRAEYDRVRLVEAKA